MYYLKHQYLAQFVLNKMAATIIIIQVNFLYIFTAQCCLWYFIHLYQFHRENLSFSGLYLEKCKRICSGVLYSAFHFIIQFNGQIE